MRKSLAFLVVGLISGISLGWLYNPAPRWEPPAPAVRQSDGSLILERKSDPTAKAPAGIPRGSKLVRVVKVEVQPKPTRVQDHNSDTLDGTNVALICPPAEIDLSLIRTPDNTERVVSSSPNGTILSGVDIPVAPVRIAKIARWSVSALSGYETTRAHRALGGSIAYWRGPFLLQGGAVGSTAFVGIGLRL
jgi:hypothetical protein